MIPVEPLISKSAGPIFAKFSGFVELWLQMISLCVLDTLVNPTKRMNGLICLLGCSHWNRGPDLQNILRFIARLS